MTLAWNPKKEVGGEDSEHLMKRLRAEEARQKKLKVEEAVALTRAAREAAMELADELPAKQDQTTPSKGTAGGSREGGKSRKHPLR